MIRNSDGSVFNVSGSISQFDPTDTSEHSLFNQWDSEIISQGGSPIIYYEVLIQPSTVDPLYLEDRGKLWSPKGIQLYCFYEPKPDENIQGLFGIDSPTEMIFELNYRDVLQRIGHPPKVGSALFTPHKSQMWRIIQRNDGEFKLWGQLRLQLICQKFQGSITDNSSTINTPQVDFKIN
jgi:hypothetical protein